MASSTSFRFLPVCSCCLFPWQPHLSRGNAKSEIRRRACLLLRSLSLLCCRHSPGGRCIFLAIFALITSMSRPLLLPLRCPGLSRRLEAESASTPCCRPSWRHHLPCSS